MRLLTAALLIVLLATPLLADAKTDEDRTKAEEFLNHLATLHDAV